LTVKNSATILREEKSKSIQNGKDSNGKLSIIQNIKKYAGKTVKARLEKKRRAEIFQTRRT